MNDYHKAMLTWGFQKGFAKKYNPDIYTYGSLRYET